MGEGDQTTPQPEGTAGDGRADAEAAGTPQSAGPDAPSAHPADPVPPPPPPGPGPVGPPTPPPYGRPAPAPPWQQAGPPTVQQPLPTPPSGQQAWSQIPPAPPTPPAPPAYPTPGAQPPPPPGQHWGPPHGHGAPMYAGGDLPPTGPWSDRFDAQQPARRGGGALIALLLVAAVVLAGAGTGLYFLLRSDGDPSEQTAADRAAAAGDRDGSDPAGSSGSGSGNAAVTACDGPPEVTVTDMRTHAMALEVSTRITASCSDGDVLDGPMSVTATSGGDVVATTRWAADDLELDGSSPTEVMFAFAPEDMLLPRDVVRGLDVDITLDRGGAGSALQPQDARRALELLVEHDSAAFRDDDTAWRAQLGSKSPGMDPAESLLGTLRPNDPEWAGALDWDEERILREHLELRESFDAKLLWSGDWRSYTHGDYFVTVVDDRFHTSESALAFCRDYNLSRDHCLAQIVSDSRGPDGSTKLQRD